MVEQDCFDVTFSEPRPATPRLATATVIVLMEAASADVVTGKLGLDRSVLGEMLEEVEAFYRDM